MADSSFAGANVVITTDTFRDWVDRTNQVLFALSDTVVTTKANSTGALTSGNAYVNGIFGANTLYAKDGLRGGTVAAGANLTLSSNLVTAANVFISGRTFFSNTVQADAITANGLVAVNTFSTVGLATIASANVQGAKNFGDVNTVSFSEQADVGNRTKFLRINSSDLLYFSAIGLSDIANVSLSGLVDEYVLTYYSGNTTFAFGPKAPGGTFAANTISANNFVALRSIELGDRTLIDDSGYVLDLFIDEGSNTSSLALKSDTITVNAITSFSLGAIGKLRTTGGANGEFLQQLNSTTGTLQFAAIDVDTFFPDAAVTTIGANVFSIDRINGRVGVGTNAVPASYVLGVLGNLHANGDVLVTGNTAVIGNVSAAGFVGVLHGSVTGTTASFSGNVIPGSNTVNLGNTTRRWVVVGNTGDFSSTLNVSGVSTLAAVNATSTVELRGVTQAFADLVPSSNAILLGNTIRRFVMSGNSLDLSSTLNVTGLATLATANVTSTVELRGVTTAFANVVPTANATNLGNTISRWVMLGNTLDLSSTLNVSGLATLATVNVTSTSEFRGVSQSFADSVPSSNAILLGNTTRRWVMSGNSLTLSSTLNVTGLSTLATANITSTAEIRGIATLYANAVPTNNTTSLGIAAGRWVMFGNTLDLSSTLNVSDLATLATANVTGVVSFQGVSTHVANALFSSDAYYTTIPNGSANSVGLRNIIPNNQNAAYTLTKADNGKMCRFSNTTGNTYTIANNSTTAYDLGHVTIIRNINTGVLKIGRGTGVTLRLAANSSNADANVAQWGYASVTQEDTDVWIISGSGVS